jgi:iron(III) transport system ATP-binding protein
VHLRQEIRSLQRQLSVTTIMVKHDHEEALSVADRIVVMNHGVIEQVGTPHQLYREPASAFVADFVGRVNVLPALTEAGGVVRVGQTALNCSHTLPAGREVKVYLRPEDVLATPTAGSGSGSAGAESVNAFEVQVEKVEFLGAYCLARVGGAALGEHRLQVVLSLDFLTRHGLETGRPLRLSVLPGRLRIFGDA